MLARCRAMVKSEAGFDSKPPCRLQETEAAHPSAGERVVVANVQGGPERVFWEPLEADEIDRASNGIDRASGHGGVKGSRGQARGRGGRHPKELVDVPKLRKPPAHHSTGSSELHGERADGSNLPR